MHGAAAAGQCGVDGALVCVQCLMAAPHAAHAHRCRSLPEARTHLRRRAADMRSVRRDGRAPASRHAQETAGLMHRTQQCLSLLHTLTAEAAAEHVACAM